ncbi:MAG: hypothetical protein KJ067_08850 [Vicinamibacteria bacterium]|nr:hypothetical protein [Vicinamibacteria bacterium]
MNRVIPRAFLFGLFAFTGPAATATAQTVYCGPGTQVTGKHGGGTGTIEEIGTEAPHVGWYRVSFTWSPRGEWYDPSTWKLHVAGTSQRCSPQRAATPPARPAPSYGRTAPTPVPPSDDDEPAAIPVPRPRTQPPAGSGGALPAGRYTCSMPGAGQFPITIVDGATYSDRGGKSGRYRVAGDQITFESGSLRGTFSRILSPGKFGLSLDQNSSFYGVCNLKR